MKLSTKENQNKGGKYEAVGLIIYYFVRYYLYTNNSRKRLEL